MRKAALIGATLIVGLLAGRATAPSPQAADRGAGPPGPSREIAGVPVGYPHTREGAVLATARYQQAFADTAILRPGVLRKRIQAAATPDFAQTMLEANSPGTERLAGGALGAGVRAGVRTMYVGVPATASFATPPPAPASSPGASPWSATPPRWSPPPTSAPPAPSSPGPAATGRSPPPAPPSAPPRASSLPAGAAKDSS
jgi:hypothetical protein